MLRSKNGILSGQSNPYVCLEWRVLQSGSSKYSKSMYTKDKHPERGVALAWGFEVRARKREALDALGMSSYVSSQKLLLVEAGVAHYLLRPSENCRVIQPSYFSSRKLLLVQARAAQYLLPFKRDFANSFRRLAAHLAREHLAADQLAQVVLPQRGSAAHQIQDHVCRPHLQASGSQPVFSRSVCIRDLLICQIPAFKMPWPFWARALLRVAGLLRTFEIDKRLGPQ